VTANATALRQDAMRTLAGARREELETALAQSGLARNYTIVRSPEIGLVMVRGRMGGDGQAFNAGEATVTRAVVRLCDGTLGYSYLLGRDARRAELAALVDALWQQPEARSAVERDVLAPIRARIAADEQARCAKVAATRVEFFTMQRGED